MGILLNAGCNNKFRLQADSAMDRALARQWQAEWKVMYDLRFRITYVFIHIYCIYIYLYIFNIHMFLRLYLYFIVI